MVAVPARADRVVEGILYAKLRSGGGRCLNLAMVPRREFIQGIGNERRGIGIEERAWAFLFLLVRVETGAASWVRTVLETGLALLLARLAVQKALAPSLLSRRGLHSELCGGRWTEG